MTHAQGIVYLIGAGPGDPGLITVRGLEILRRADVVIHDRLVARELLAEAPAGARVVDGSKYPGGEGLPQDDIHRILIDEARRGKTVVRLKGGDPFVFGRGGEELAACRAAGVAVVVVPGVTSALAAPAAAGISVTQRGVARSVVILTASAITGADAPPPPLDSLAGIDTIVVLMGRALLDEIARRLIAAGRKADEPAACIERAWMEGQRVVAGTLGTIARQAADADLRAPIVIVIGAVAGL